MDESCLINAEYIVLFRYSFIFILTICQQFVFRDSTLIRKCAKFLQTRPMLTNEVNGPKMQKSMTFYEAGKFKTIFTTQSDSIYLNIEG